MAAGDITLDGSPLGVGIAVSSEVTAGNSNRLEFESPQAAEYGVNGGVIVRAALTTGEIFNFDHWFSYEEADQVEAMALLSQNAELAKEGDYHIFLSDERCKVPDTDPPVYAYVPGSLEVTNPGLTSKVHRIYKAIFRNRPVTTGHADFGKELSFVMQVADPYFAAEQQVAPEIVVFNVQTLAADVDTSTGSVLVAEFY